MSDLSFEGDYGLNDSFRSDSESRYLPPLGHSLLSEAIPPPHIESTPVLRLCHLPGLQIPGHLPPSPSQTLQKDLEIQRLLHLSHSSSDLIPELRLTITRYEHQIEGMKGEIEALERTVQGLRAAAGNYTEVAVENERLRKELERREKEITGLEGNETRLINFEEIKHLRQSLVEKNQKLASLERLVPVNKLDSGHLFKFLSSQQAAVWTQICAAVSEMQVALGEKQREEVGELLGKLIAGLEQAEDSVSVEEMAEESIRMSKALNSVKIPWDLLKDIVEKTKELCISEIHRQSCTSSPANPSLSHSEEYLSDFSDEDFSVEISEETAAQNVIKQLKSALPKFQFSHSGPISPLNLFELLRLRVIEAEESGLEALIRRLPLVNECVVYENFVQDVKHKQVQWWMKVISAQSFDMQNQNKAGTFVQNMTWDEWTKKRLVEKIRRFLAQEKLTISSFSSSLFTSPQLTKRELRRKLRDMRVPLNREDCHSLFSLLDLENSGVVTEMTLVKAMESEEPAPAAQEKKEETGELRGLSEKDARFRLLQAENHISALRLQQSSIPPHLTREHTLHLEASTLRKDLELLTSQLEETRRNFRDLLRENETLKMQLMSHQSHFREGENRKTDELEAEIKNLKDGLKTFNKEKDAILMEMKRKHDEDKAGLMRLVRMKNRELETLNTEVDRLLRDLQELRQEVGQTR